MKKKEQAEKEQNVQNEKNEETIISNEQILGDEIKVLKDEVKLLKDELQLSTDKYLRLAAEYDNFRKRTAKEKESIYGDAFSKALVCVLPIKDNLERALLHRNEPDSLIDGINLTLKQFESAFSQLNAEEINPEGEKFDPNFHNAVAHIADEGFDENTVVEVFQKGLKVGDKVIRYAMVKVAN